MPATARVARRSLSGAKGSSVSRWCNLAPCFSAQHHMERDPAPYTTHTICSLGLSIDAEFLHRKEYHTKTSFAYLPSSGPDRSKMRGGSRYGLGGVFGRSFKTRRIYLLGSHGRAPQHCSQGEQ
eukprot:scaffold1960_cov242-Pinguiococcus_pyrenoidosus.AAC.5